MRFDLENSSLIWQDTLGRDCIATIHHLIYTVVCNGNAGVTPALANASVVFGAVEEVWEKTTATGAVGSDNSTRLTTALAYRLSLPTDMHVHYGAP